MRDTNLLENVPFSRQVDENKPSHSLGLLSSRLLLSKDRWRGRERTEVSGHEHAATLGKD